MLFKILFIISLMYAYGFNNNNRILRINKKQLYKTIIYEKEYNANNKDYGSEYDVEMCEEEQKLHKEIKTEEENAQYIQDVIKLQKYQTMYKLLKYLVDNKLSIHEKMILLTIFKKEIDNRKF